MKSQELKQSMTLSTMLLVSLIMSPLAIADVTSPSIKDRGKTYSSEKPLSDYYGIGNSGRLSEASELRMAVDDLLAAGEYEKAIAKAKKAVQLDPGDPSGHLFLAKALTNKFYQQKGDINEKLLGECMREWQIIRYHDADPTEQWEAGGQVKQLQKLAKALEKEKLHKEKEKLAKASAEAKKNHEKASPETCSQVAEKTSSPANMIESQEKDKAASDKHQLAERKKHFVLF